MIRLPGARSLLDCRARTAEQGPATLEQKALRKAKGRGRRARRVLEEQSALLLDGFLADVCAHAIPPTSVFHLGAHKLLSGSQAFWASPAVLEAALPRGDTHLRQKKTCSANKVSCDSRNLGLSKMAVS